MSRLTTKVLHMNTDRITKALAQVVSAAIKADGQTQRKIAEATGIPLVTLNRRLTGQSAFNVVELASIAKVLDLSIVEFFLRVERMATANAA